MGDLVGQVVGGRLHYLPYSQFERIRYLSLPSVERASIFADMCRLNVLYMIARAGSGHIGSSFSSLDIMSWLALEELEHEDIFFSSKGHDAPGYYSTLLGLGKLNFDLTHKLRRIDGLPGHPDIATPGIVTNTGSLGMGISKAKGIVLANRIAKKTSRVFVMTGDGELQEGQFWESLISAANFGLHEIIAIVDHNKLQSDTFVKNVSDLGDLEGKLRAFGWRVERCDGNNISEFSQTIQLLRDDPRPKIIVADTIKGKGVSFMEHTSLDSDLDMYRFHSGAPDANSYQRAAAEIIERLQLRAVELQIPEFEFETIEREQSTAPSKSAQRLVAAYGQALVQEADKNKNIVVLDADLILDTGLIPFRERYPDRFIECGIAEQDMVSMAGGMALSGMLPIVHSFACFLSARPNEQIYNNATEKTKIIYVGSLAGVVPGGPGHSHQAVRDISVLASIPDMILVEPSCEAEVSMLLRWCIKEATGPSYIRLVSLPWEIPYSLPGNYQPILGRGIEIVEGTDVCIIAYGPVLLTAAFEASVYLAKFHNITASVINLPWLNFIDSDWLVNSLMGFKKIISLDNHYTIGGQGTMIARVITINGLKTNIIYIGVDEIPPCGSNYEVLHAIGLVSATLVEAITCK